MNDESNRNSGWNDLSRSRSGFLAKSNPNVRRRLSAESEAPGGGRAEFPARTNPNYGRTPLTDEQKALAARHVSLARILARQFHSGRHVDRDELESVAFEALVEAARAYLGIGGAQFPTFARYRIVGAILDCFRKTGKHRRRQSSATRGYWPGEYSGTPVWITPDLPVGAEFDGVDSIEAHFRRMPSSQARACRLIYLEGKSQSEAAEIMDCTKSYISKIHRDALDFLAECFQDRLDRPPVETEDSRGRDGRPQLAPIRSRSKMTELCLLATAC